MKRRQAILASSLGSVVIVALLTFFVIPWHLSYSAEDVSNVFRNALSSSGTATITVTGESSMRIEPDQITIDVSVQGAPTDVNNIVSNQNEYVKKVVNAINSAVGQDNASIKVSQTSINPLYSSGNPIGSTLFIASSSYPVKTDFIHFSDIASKLANAGFRMDSLTVTEVPVNASKADSVDISITTGSGSSATADCVVANNCFTPNPLNISSGTTVTWTNKDGPAHTVTSGSPADSQTGTIFDSGLIKSGATFSYTFYNTGTYNYYCAVHPWMTGTITVTGDNLTPDKQETKSQVTMNLVIDTKPDTLQNTANAYQARLATLTKILDENGIPSSDTKQNQVNFNQVYTNPVQYSSFSANTDVIVKTDPRNLDKIVNATKDAKANISSISFSVSDSAIDSARKQLTQNALEDATKNAQNIIEQSGLQIKGIKKIEINPAISNQAGNAVPYNGVRIITSDPFYYATGQTTVSVNVEFEVGK